MHPAPFAEFLEFYLALHELPILARPIVRARALLTGQFYQLILRHGAAYSSIKKACLANFVPGAEEGAFAHERLHNEIDDKPRAEDKDEPDTDVPENLLRLPRLPGVPSRRDVIPTGIGKEDGGEKDGEIDARVEDVLRKLADIAESAVNAGARDYLCRLSKHERWW